MTLISRRTHLVTGISLEHLAYLLPLRQFSSRMCRSEVLHFEPRKLNACVYNRYIGFDSVTTAAMEAKNPRRDLPIGIIGSLIVTTVIYIAFCTVMTGAAPYTELNVATPVTVAVDFVEQRTGKSWQWLNIVVTLGALLGLTSVLLIMMLGQTRVFYSMAKDGLLPAAFAKVHPRFQTPYIATIAVGTITAIMAAILPVDLLGNMTSVGTLLAFFIVHAGVILLRFTRPDVQRWFKIPGGKYLFVIFPVIGMVISVLLIAVAEVTTIWVSLIHTGKSRPILTLHCYQRLFVWMGIGWVVYFSYSIRHAKLHRDPIGRFAEVREKVDENKDTNEVQQEYDFPGRD